MFGSDCNCANSVNNVNSVNDANIVIMLNKLAQLPNWLQWRLCFIVVGRTFQEDLTTILVDRRVCD